MRNLLEEFRGNHGLRPPTILGVREHVFTGRFRILSHSHMRLHRDTVFFYTPFVLCLNMQCLLLGLVHVQSRD